MTRLEAMDDRALVQAVAAGDERAAGELFRRHRRAMHACALSVLRDPHDADDAVQIATARALAAIPRDRPRRLRPWLLAVARNEALMLLRSRVPREALSAELPDAQSVEGAFALREEIAGLVVDLRDLPDRQRTALVLRHLYELSYGDIGRLLGIRPATARQAVLQARRSLVTRAQARDQDCGDIRLLLAGDGRARRAVAVRAHLNACPACRAAAPAGLAARIRSLLPLPEPMLPPLLLRLIGGPGTSLRGGAAAACLCTFAIGLGIVNEMRRGPERPPAASPAVIQPPDRSARVARAAEERQRPARRVVAGVRPQRPQATAPITAPAAAAAPAPAPQREPDRAAPRPPAAAPPTPSPADARTPHVTVEVLDDTSVTVWGYDLNNLPVVGPLPVEPPIDPEPLLP